MKTSSLQRSFALSCIAAAAFALCGGAHAQTQPQAQANAEMAEQLRQLREEMRQLKAELEAIKRQPAATAQAPSASGWGAAPVAVGAAAAAGQAPAGAVPAAGGATGASLFGYGELSFTRPRGNAAASTATAGRGVLGYAYRFNDRTRMAAEIEIENAVVSAGDKGEAAFEQLYIEHDINNSISAKAGLFLMPVGFLNETHEPTRYFGVRRNLVETAIIPTTWRELGIGLRGTTEAGLRWDTGMVTSFDLTKWDAASEEGKESPLGAIHQEGQLAKARSLGMYGALNYNGIPGFNVGGSLFRGGVGHKQPDFAASNATVTLGEVHARWQPGRWDLSALAATGRFKGVEALNATFAGQPTPVPDRFGGWYAQAAYRLWQQGDYALAPFLRYERLNTARSYSGLPAGMAPEIAPDTRAWTAGANFYLHPQVVFKVDLQRYLNDHSLDRFNLGVGFHF